MKTYVINYHTGVKNTVEVEDLNEAKEVAVEGMEYTQENVTIETPEGETLLKSKWYGVESEDALVSIGDGHYSEWFDPEE